MRQSSPDRHEEQEALYETANCLSPVDAACYLDKAIYLSNTLLRDVDVMSMAHSLEIRVPLLDHFLVEYSAALPSAMKYRNHNGKYLLIKAIEDLLPHEVIHRPKMGFAYPLGFWLHSKPMRDVMEDCLSPRGHPGREMFAGDAMRRIIDDDKSVFEKNPPSFQSERLWMLTILELWLREVIDAAEPPIAAEANDE
jgi:asparagine synthase (glutamine-hydrolysing)